MPALTIYLVILLLVMAVVMMGVATTTCLQVFRLRNKRLSWRAGTLKGFPLFSTLFLGVSILLASAMWQYGSGWQHWASASFYLLISISWFTSSYFSSKCYITDNGIVKNVNDPAQTVPWHQIHDFFDQAQNGDCLYTFIYRKNNREPIKKVVRLQLRVPASKHAAFKRLISHKLGRRISCYDESIDVAQFE